MFFKDLLFYFYNIKERLFHTTTEQEIALIKNTKLFDSLDETSFSELLASMTLLYCAQDELILKKGHTGDAFYIISEGSVRVFTETPENKKVPLARLNKGDYFGEQALLGHSNKTRNASIEAITDVILIKISEAFIFKLLHIDKDLEARLKKIGHQQILNNLSSSLNVYQGIIDHIKADTEKNLIYIKKGEIIFHAGDRADYVYLIVEGKIKIEIPSQPEAFTLFLEEQHIFGEVGVIYNKPRSGSATAAENSILARIEVEEFRKIYQAHPQLQQLLKTLGNSYTLPNRGLTQQYFGKAMRLDTVTTVYELIDGRKAIATNTIERENFVIEEQPLAKALQSYTYSSDKDSKVELGLSGDYIVSIKCNGAWDDLPNACAALLDRKTVPLPVLDNFIKVGVFKLPKTGFPVVVPDTLCDCMLVQKKVVEDLISAGVRSLAQISQKTGACTVCGSCRSRILCLLGQEVWMSALMTKSKVHNEHVVSFQLKPSMGKFAAAQPGQHVVIQVRIGEVWVERAYTLTDLLNDGNLSITIKKENNGFFTQWLFSSLAIPIPIYVCQPQGNFVLPMAATNPVLCFAGGIGITPFITFAKALKNSSSPRQLHIVYIASSKNDFIFVDELEEIAKQNPHITFTLWEKKVEGNMTKEKVASLIEKLHQPNIYICGPEGWETSLVAALQELDYNKDMIFIEKFTYANPIIPETSSL